MLHLPAFTLLSFHPTMDRTALEGMAVVILLNPEPPTLGPEPGTLNPKPSTHQARVGRHGRGERHRRGAYFQAVFELTGVEPGGGVHRGRQGAEGARGVEQAHQSHRHHGGGYVNCRCRDDAGPSSVSARGGCTHSPVPVEIIINCSEQLIKYRRPQELQAHLVCISIYVSIYTTVYCNTPGAVYSTSPRPADASVPFLALSLPSFSTSPP